MNNILFKKSVHNLNRLDCRYRFLPQLSSDELIVKIFVFNKNAGAYLLEGVAMRVNTNESEFKSGVGFKLIKNKNIKAELIKLACDYCNKKVNLGGELKC